jgi:hypothetical protein
VTQDPWAEDAPIQRRHHGCLVFFAVLVVGAMVVTVLASYFNHLAIEIAVVVVVVAVVAGLVIFFRGPPET